ncbi:MAG TPA: acyl-CoA desaturase [Ktedonobacterales bacterium]
MVITSRTSSPPSGAPPGAPPPGDEASYAELKRLVKEHGLLDRHPLRALARVAIVDALLVVSVAVLFGVHIFWVQCLNALLLAFVSTQLGFTGHDAGHRQSFASTRLNDAVGLVHGNLGLGMSFSWWMDKHNRHHSHPNEIDSDPDIDIPQLAFTPEDAARKRGFGRFVAAHQVWFFFPLLMLVALDLQRSSVLFLLRDKVRHPKTETLLLVLHYVIYLGVIFSALPAWQAVVFIVIHKAATGLYLGSTFAPNHKGMLLIEHNSTMDFLRRQVLTARNVRAHPLTDIWYGGLNYQIEHHLFPAMSRGNLPRAQKVIRAYCQGHGVSYYETSMLRSYGEILAYLHAVGACLRSSVA